jgi:hypothetical protein
VVEAAVAAAAAVGVSADQAVQLAAARAAYLAAALDEAVQSADVPRQLQPVHSRILGSADRQ